MPPMVGGIFYEHGHRMVATFVGLLTTVLAIWLWRREERKWVRTLGWVALAAVVAQGLLGGLTVLLLLPTAISVSHATLAQSFFCLTLVIAMATSPAWKTHRAAELPMISSTRTFALVAAGTVFLQLILGALMRHTQSGLAIPDFPLSYGGIIPPVNSSNLADINDYRLGLDLPPVGLMQVWIHFAHRAGALVATAAIVSLVLHVLKRFDDRKLREPAIVLLLLLIVQILLGAITVWTGKNIQVATAHVATGALLLGVSVMLTVRSYHLYRAPARELAPNFVPEVSRS